MEPAFCGQTRGLPVRTCRRYVGQPTVPAHLGRKQTGRDWCAPFLRLRSVPRPGLYASHRATTAGLDQQFAGSHCNAQVVTPNPQTNPKHAIWIHHHDVSKSKRFSAWRPPLQAVGRQSDASISVQQPSLNRLPRATNGPSGGGTHGRCKHSSQLVRSLMRMGERLVQARLGHEHSRSLDGKCACAKEIPASAPLPLAPLRGPGDCGGLE
jgi:hypothetical protein